MTARRPYGRITDEVRATAVVQVARLMETANMRRTAACRAVADQLDVSANGVLNWYRQAYGSNDPRAADIVELRRQLAAAEECLRMSRELNQSLLDLNANRDFR
jgi:hypothetical protein